METTGGVRAGMRVYGSDGAALGEVERVEGHEFLVQGARFPLSSVARVDEGSVYLGDPGAFSDAIDHPTGEVDDRF